MKPTLVTFCLLLASCASRVLYAPLPSQPAACPLTFRAQSSESVAPAPEIIIPIPQVPGYSNAWPESATSLLGPWRDRTAEVVQREIYATNGNVITTNNDWFLPRTPGAAYEFYRITFYNEAK